MSADNYPDRGESSDTSSPPQPPILDTIASSSSSVVSNLYAFNNRNGTSTKRRSDFELAAGGPSSNIQWKFHKQHSLDSIAKKSIVTEAIKNQNFYSERPSEPDIQPINYSIKFDASGKTNLTPKLTRNDSAPVYLLNNKPSSPATSCYLPITTTTMSANEQPIINFDFTRVPLSAIRSTAEAASSLPLLSPALSSSSYLSKVVGKSIPELMPINYGNRPTILVTPSPKTSNAPFANNHSVANILRPDNRTQLTSIEVNDRKFNRTASMPLPPSVLKTDLKNSPLIKIDYSVLNLSNSQPSQTQVTALHSKSRTVTHKTLPSRSLSVSSLPSSPPQSYHSSILFAEATTSSTTAQQTAVINVNFNHTSAAPIISYSIPSTTISNLSTLEMDEDYDNI